MFVLVFISLSIYSQKTVLKNYESEELQDVRNIKIHLPKNYEQDSTSNFPITFVLSSEKLYDLYVGNADFFTLTDRAPAQIIVGINTSRTLYDDTNFDKETGELTENSKSFYQFIKTELLPYIEVNYKTSPFISIVGEGVAGNFITHYLKEQTPIFNAYICVNPTFSSNIVSQISSYSLDKYTHLDNTFFLYVSNSPFNSSEKNKNIFQLTNYLTSLNIKNFNYTYNHLKDSPSNLSAISEAIPRALTDTFKLYAGISRNEFETNVKQLSPVDAITYLENKYLNIEYLFGTNLGIRESDIFLIEDIIINKENGDYLKDFGKMILSTHPKSPIGNYYLGRYFESGKLYRNALKHYKIGYGKIDPSDPNAEKFYQNIERLLTYNR